MRCPKHGESMFDGCAECKDDELEPAYADNYAIACIVYYGGSGLTMMTDAQFDGLCSWLLSRGAWKRIPWLSHEMLRCGSGYDLTVFPETLHKRATAWITAMRETRR